MQHHIVLKVAAKLLLPFILLFALYVQFHGDFGPGGGFQAGVIFGAGVILYALVFGVAHARAVITPTETVRAELLERCGAPPGAVHAVHEAGRLDHVTAAEPPPDVPPRFVLHVGTIEPRKNVATLLDAWPRLRAAMPDAPPLVLCGKFGWGRESIEGELARAASEGWLRQLGYAPDETLRALYDRAALVVCPSHYEGFGLPLVEAMSAATPLVCSDIPVFREVAADAALFVPPDDATAWARVVGKLLSDPRRARDLAARGSARARDFSWRRTAERTLAVWSDAARSA